MSKKIFVNLPVKNLSRSVGFFQDLGFTFDEQFTDETAACMVVSGDIYAMLLTEEKFKEFTRKEIADATKTTEVLTCLSVGSKTEVNRLVDTALKSGAVEVREPVDMGFMFGRSFDDLDGHIWEIVWMDPEHVQQ